MVRTCGQKFAWALALVMTLGMTARLAIADEEALSPEQVRKMFATNCSWCHGDFGKKAGKGPKLAGTSMNEQQIHDRIAKGAPGGAMPSYKKLLTEEQINALVTYIKGLPGE